MGTTVPALGFSPGVAVASQTVNTNGDSGVVPINQGYNFGAVFTVSQISGTNPTINVALQVSEDGGATWTDVWHFEQLTGPGSSIMPVNAVAGVHRYVWTISGTNPSVTFAITETSTSQAVKLIRRFFDYSAGLLAGALNAVGQAFRIDGAVAITATLTLGAGGTSGEYELQISADGVNWATVPYDTQHPAVVSGTIVWVSPGVSPASYVRIAVTTAAGSPTTGVVASITAT